MDAAQREMTTIAESLAREYPSSNDRMGVFVTPLLESVAGRARPMLAALGCAVSVLLLMACANVANLLLTRGLGRERETSIRSALGASRRRLIRLFLVEGLILGTAGAVAGLLLAGWGVRVLRAVPGIALPRTADIAINPQALGFAGLLALTTAALFAFAPAWHLSRVDLMHTLRVAGSTDGSRRATRLRSTLVAIEVGLLVVLLACATLMQRTLTYLAGVDPGFRADGLMAVRLVQPGQQYDGDTAARFAARLDDSIRATGHATAAVAWPFDYTGFSGRRTSISLRRLFPMDSSPLRKPPLSHLTISRRWGFRSCADGTSDLWIAGARRWWRSSVSRSPGGSFPMPIRSASV